MSGKGRKDYYRVLQVAPDASNEEIKRAYRRLAREHHPDVNPGDGEAERRFKEINEAYQVLSDPESRRAYDRRGQRAPRPEGPRSRAATPDPFDELLEILFGRPRTARPSTRPGRQEAPRGRTYEAHVTLSLEEAYHGKDIYLTVEGRRVPVRIPPGARDGMTLRLRGAGGRNAYGTHAGDLLVRVHVRPHPRYTLQGNDIVVTAEVDLFTALLGGTVRVETFEGPLEVTVRPETQSDSVVRVPNRGMPDPQDPSRRGDLLVALRVVMPSGLSNEERRLVQQLAQLRRRRTARDHAE